MLEVIHGANKKDNSTAQLVEVLQQYFSGLDDEGMVFIGYPILSTTVGGLIIDAVLITQQHGIVVFDLVEDTTCSENASHRDSLYANTKSRLIQYPDLMNGRELGVSLEVLTYAPQVKQSPETSQDFINTNEAFIARLDAISNESNVQYFKPLVSTVQAVTKLSNQRRRHTIKTDSRGAKLKVLEASIANLDSRQNRAVIETVEGPQRIRGLAGSGKTIILALKAAYLHSRYPEWDIAITFNVRSLKKQFVDLVTKFTIEQKREDPDWEKIKIVQSWGSHSSSGIYYDFCVSNGLMPLDFRSANAGARKGLSPLGYACLVARKQLKEKGLVSVQKYDAILIDEAQDLSPAFLQLCYDFLREPKRIIWAYDELQNLSVLAMKSPKELFGIDLSNGPDEAQKDIILERCYRNSRPVLVTAHGLGFGTAREEGLVQMFDDPSLWEEIGYEVESGELIADSDVVLQRTSQTSPVFLESHSALDDIIQVSTFESNEAQSEWIANEIQKNLIEDELTTEDIVVVTLNPLTAEEDTTLLRSKLLEREISNHIAGVTTSPDYFFKEDSIAITGIYRAKGNESAMVYVMNSQFAYTGSELIRKRNMLFSAITRSKAWVRITGVGENMAQLALEYEKIKESGFKLSFKYPTPEEMERIRLINRDLTDAEKRRKKRSLIDVGKLAEDLEKGVIRPEEIDPQVKKQLALLFADKKDE